MEWELWLNRLQPTIVQTSSSESRHLLPSSSFPALTGTSSWASPVCICQTSPAVWKSPHNWWNSFLRAYLVCRTWWNSSWPLMVMSYYLLGRSYQIRRLTEVQGWLKIIIKIRNRIDKYIQSLFGLWQTLWCYFSAAVDHHIKYVLCTNEIIWRLLDFTNGIGGFFLESFLKTDVQQQRKFFAECVCKVAFNPSEVISEVSEP